jgi:hypothetical protein
MEKGKKFENFYQSTEDIPLELDSYNDIFSDFDPRQYSERALSDDFLYECKKASADKKGKINLKFFIPKSKRVPLDEIKIKKRLKEHFHKHFLEKKRELDKLKLEGFSWFVAGCLMLVLSAVFLDNNQGTFWYNLLIILAHPAGWFFMWEGLEKILITPNEKVPDYLFYKKMIGASISFFNS